MKNLRSIKYIMMNDNDMIFLNTMINDFSIMPMYSQINDEISSLLLYNDGIRNYHLINSIKLIYYWFIDNHIFPNDIETYGDKISKRIRNKNRNLFFYFFSKFYFENILHKNNFQIMFDSFNDELLKAGGGGILLINNNKILVVEEISEKYGFPKGRSEIILSDDGSKNIYESHDLTAFRELKEETYINKEDVSLIKNVNGYDIITKNCIYTWYIGTIIKPNININRFELLKASFIDDLDLSTKLSKFNQLSYNVLKYMFKQIKIFKYIFPISFSRFRRKSSKSRK